MTNNNSNNPAKTIGIIIMVIGLAIAIYTGFMNDVSNENVVDVRGVQLTTDRANDVNWGPYAGIGLIIIGGVVYFAGRKKIVTNDRNSRTNVNI